MFQDQSNSYEDKIPAIWKHTVDKKWLLFLSNKTLQETTKQALDIWMKENNFCMQRFAKGAYVRPVFNQEQ